MVASYGIMELGQQNYVRIILYVYKEYFFQVDCHVMTLCWSLWQWFHALTKIFISNFIKG